MFYNQIKFNLSVAQRLDAPDQSILQSDEKAALQHKKGTISPIPISNVQFKEGNQF
jgi:hypothetical protein